MGIFRSRFPASRDILLTFASCVFPVYVWSILNLLREVPAWVLRLTSWELMGVIAYAQVFALVESALVALVLTFLGVILPGRFLRDRFVAQSSMLVFVTGGWAVAVHYNDQIIRLWGPRQFLLWSVFYLASIGILYMFIHRSKKVESLIRSFAERLSVLSWIYVSLGLLSVIIVLVRNIGGGS